MLIKIYKRVRSVRFVIGVQSHCRRQAAWLLSLSRIFSPLCRPVAPSQRRWWWCGCMADCTHRASPKPTSHMSAHRANYRRVLVWNAQRRGAMAGPATPRVQSIKASYAELRCNGRLCWHNDTRFPFELDWWYRIRAKHVVNRAN